MNEREVKLRKKTDIANTGSSLSPSELLINTFPERSDSGELVSSPTSVSRFGLPRGESSATEPAQVATTTASRKSSATETTAEIKLKNQLVKNQENLAKISQHFTPRVGDLERLYRISNSWVEFHCEAKKSDKKLKKEIEKSLDEGISKGGEQDSKLSQHLAELRAKIVEFEITRIGSRFNYALGLGGGVDFVKLPILEQKKKKKQYPGWLMDHQF